MDIKPGPKPETNVFCFLDEVGTLHKTNNEQIFGLGLLKLQSPHKLHKAIVNFKNKRNYHKEFKFCEVENNNLNLYKEFIDLFFSMQRVEFSCLVFDKNGLNIEKHFQNNYFKAYNTFTAKLINRTLGVSEYITVLADDISTPKSDNFEKEIKAKVKKKTRRNALFGICRVESSAVSELQMCDVLLGTIAYAFKIKHELVSPKKNARLALVKHLQKHLNTDVLSQTYKYTLRFGRKVSVWEVKGDISKKVGSAVDAIVN